MDAEIVMTRKIEEVAPNRLMGKMILTFTVMGKPVKIHIEFKDPIPISEFPRTVLESPEEDLLEELEAQIWVHKPDEQIDRIEEVARVEEEDKSDSE